MCSCVLIISEARTVKGCYARASLCGLVLGQFGLPSEKRLSSQSTEWKERNFRLDNGVGVGKHLFFELCFELFGRDKGKTCVIWLEFLMVLFEIARLLLNNHFPKPLKTHTLLGLHTFQQLGKDTSWQELASLTRSPEASQGPRFTSAAVAENLFTWFFLLLRVQFLTFSKVP